MKRFLVISLVVILTLALVLPVLVVGATNTSAGDTSTTPAQPALVINAPDTTRVGENTKILITEKSGSLPVAGAGVWAVFFPDVSASSEADLDVSNSGIDILLGYTDAAGYVICTFKRTGLFVLVTFKDGYLPGFGRITVKPAVKALAIKSPATALAGEPVTILVYDRNTVGVVPQANVWAVAASAIPVDVSVNTADTAALIARYGQYLGQTNDAGQLTFKLLNPDRYLLVAVEDTYLPGFAKITIQSAKALVIRNPAVVHILAPVEIRVVEKSVLPVEIPVSGASVWAVKPADVAALDDTTDFTAVTEKYGLYLGMTDEQGYVNPKPSFHQAGKYWLIALKAGYIAGRSVIEVSPLVTATPTILPNTSTSSAIKSGAGKTASITMK
jgi:hypothetical protein